MSDTGAREALAAWSKVREEDRIVIVRTLKDEASELRSKALRTTQNEAGQAAQLFRNAEARAAAAGVLEHADLLAELAEAHP